MINSFWMELGKFYQKKPLLEIDHQEEEGLSQKREFQENEYLWVRNQKRQQWGALGRKRKLKSMGFEELFVTLNSLEIM